MLVCLSFYKHPTSVDLFQCLISYVITNYTYTYSADLNRSENNLFQIYVSLIQS